MRYPTPFKREGSPFWYFVYRDPSGKRVTRSTQCKLKRDAEEYVRDYLDDLWRRHERRVELRTFGEYSEPFFLWDRCPHVARLRDEGRSIGETHVKKSRQWLESYVLGDPFCETPIGEITRGDLVDLRARVRRKVEASLRERGLFDENYRTGANTTDKVMDSVKTILSEAHFRQDIPADPGARVGKVHRSKRETGAFTGPEETASLFAERPGIWRDRLGWQVFAFAAHTGLRQSEVLALSWAQLADGILEVNRAWKTPKTIGLPKWGKVRTIPLPEAARQIVVERRAEAPSTTGDALVFCYPDGSRLGVTWWGKRFNNAMSEAGIDRAGRNIRPHSFRHSLNTHLLANHVNTLLVEAYLGWTRHSPVVVARAPDDMGRVQRGYTHLTPSDLRPVASAIDRLYLRARA